MHIIFKLKLVQVSALHCLLFLRCSRTSMPALYPRPVAVVTELKAVVTYVARSTEPNGAPDLAIPGRPHRKGAVAPDAWCTASQSRAIHAICPNTQSEPHEVGETLDTFQTNPSHWATRIRITSCRYEPVKGRDGLLSPRMVSSSAFHLRRPDCQCLTTPPRHGKTVEVYVTCVTCLTYVTLSLGIQLEVEDISELLGWFLHLLLVLLTKG